MKIIKLLLTFMSLSLMLSSLLIVEVAKADPIMPCKFDAAPIIAIQSPENNKTYSPSNIILTFNLSKPTENLGGYPYSNNWFEPRKGYGDDFGNRVVNATYYIDGQPSNISIDVNSHLLSPFNCSLPINGLTDGRHSLQICLFCNGVAGFIWAAGGSLEYDNYLSYSQIVNFTVDGTPPVPMFQLVGAMPSLVVASVIVILAAASLLLVYYKRRGRKT